MPDTVKVTEDFDAASVAPKVEVPNSTIEKMSAESGESVESIRKKLGLDAVNTDQASDVTLLAGKFKSEEALNDGIRNITDKLEMTPEATQKIIDALGPEKAYKHFEQELGAKAKPAAEKPAEKDALSDDEPEKDALSDDSTKDPEKDAEKEAAAPKVEWEKLSAEYAESGTLSEESIESLSKVVPPQFVNQYLEAIGAQQELMTMKVHDIMGGEENYDTVIEWAKTNLSASEKAKFNASLNTTVKNAVDMATALKSRYEKANGSMSRVRIDGSETNSAALNTYQSKEEMQRDMRDPRYRSGDPAFHAMVMRKMRYAKF